MQTPGYPTTRRRFLTASTAALGLAPMTWLRSQDASPNDDINMGIIGCGGMGTGNMRNFLNIPGVRVVAVCDVDSQNAANAKSMVDGHYKNEDCKLFRRHEDLLAVDGLDAVSIATPDHWHARIGIDAANAGKDIYGEKPFTWGLTEGRALVEAVTRNERIWQTGSQQRTGGEFRRFKALIENNVLGKLTRFECGTPAGMSIRNHMPQDQWEAAIGNAPDHLDWEQYSKPAGDHPYHPMIHPWNWRWTNEFGGGQLLDWVGHHVDIALWTLGLDNTGPVKVSGTGEKGNHPVFNTYTRYEYQGTFEDGRVIEVRSNFGGTKFTGENGWLHVNRGRLHASDDPNDTEGDPRHELLRELPEDFETRVPTHHQNFIESIRSRKQPVAPAESTHRSSSFGQLAIVAIDSETEIKWDPAAEKVIDNAEAAAHPRLGARI